MKKFDSVVIGAGPAGITSAMFLSRFGLKAAMVESLTPGGQMLSTFEIDNYPGLPAGTAGWNLADSFVANLESYDIARYTETVKAVTREGELYRVHLEKEIVEARTIIACSGAARRKLQLPGEVELTGRGVSYCAMCDGMFFKGKTVAVVGGGNSAIEEALHLSALAGKLYLIHRRDSFRADHVFQKKLEQHEGIEVLLGQSVTGLRGEDKLTGIEVTSAADGSSRILDVDGLFVFVGITPVNEYLPLGLEKDHLGFVKTDCEMRTNMPGFFAAGDVRAKQCRQIVTAVGDAATAAYSAFLYLERKED